MSNAPAAWTFTGIFPTSGRRLCDGEPRIEPQFRCDRGPLAMRFRKPLCQPERQVGRQVGSVVIALFLEFYGG